MRCCKNVAVTPFTYHGSRSISHFQDNTDTGTSHMPSYPLFDVKIDTLLVGARVPKWAWIFAATYQLASSAERTYTINSITGKFTCEGVANTPI